MANTLMIDMAGLRDRVGSHLGYTEWRTITQEQVNQFADATDDHQYIHVDPERARDSMFGGTVAHGFMTLSLVAPVTQELYKVTDASTGVNYGLDRVRFPGPMRVGSRWRGGAELLEASEIEGGLAMKLRVTIEVDGAPRPACVAESLLRVYH
jgi:acyl dehydratase